MLKYKHKNKKEEMRVFFNLIKENESLKRENKRLRDLCETKDSFFMELMSDALRNKSKLAGKHMAERKEFLKGK